MCMHKQLIWELTGAAGDRSGVLLKNVKAGIEVSRHILTGEKKTV